MDATVENPKHANRGIASEAGGNGVCGLPSAPAQSAVHRRMIDGRNRLCQSIEKKAGLGATKNRTGRTELHGSPRAGNPES